MLLVQFLKLSKSDVAKVDGLAENHVISVTVSEQQGCKTF